MNLKIGSQTFEHVDIPLLWGTRAVVGHSNGALSIICLDGMAALSEVIADKPAVEVEYSERDDGYVILREGIGAYFFSSSMKLLRDLSGYLPECQISTDGIRVGNSRIQRAPVMGSQVGIGVTEQGFFVGGPVPPGLAPLLV
jgi:hypothetical protein